MTAMMTVIEILLNTGTKVEVPAQVHGPYAVHQQFGPGGKKALRGWAVTHRASGLLVWKTFRREDAFKIAMWLVRESPLPSDCPDPAVLSTMDLAGLSCQLQQLAPRWDARMDPVPVSVE